MCDFVGKGQLVAFKAVFMCCWIIRSAFTICGIFCVSFRFLSPTFCFDDRRSLDTVRIFTCWIDWSLIIIFEAINSFVLVSLQFLCIATWIFSHLANNAVTDLWFFLSAIRSPAFVGGWQCSRRLLALSTNNNGFERFLLFWHLNGEYVRTQMSNNYFLTNYDLS